MFTRAFIWMGWSRDDWKFWWAQIVSLCALVVSGVFDITYWGNYLSIPISPTVLHWVMAVSAFVLWVSARHSATTLPSASAMASGDVPGSPVAKADDKVDVSKYGPLVLVLLLAAGSWGCAKAPPSLSPPGVAAFNALRVVRALDVVRDTAIDAEAQVPPLISTADTRTVIDFHEAALKTIAAVPSGWKATVLAGLDQLKTDIVPAAWARIQIYVNLLKAVIAEVAP